MKGAPIKTCSHAPIRKYFAKLSGSHLLRGLVKNLLKMNDIVFNSTLIGQSVISLKELLSSFKLLCNYWRNALKLLIP
jgi:hypothetical protein